MSNECKNFLEYFKKKSSIIFEISEKMEEPSKDEFINILMENINNMINLIKELSKSDFIDINFISYLSDNMKVGPYQSYKHSLVWYITDSGRDSYYFTCPEIIKQAWINYKITMLWLEEFKKDGFI